ncbi:VOC family protein [Erythrobacter sp.]|uniref:VOC family protein n=1 Tax=Erythrobacter sp. TaxID=1042 RepID=UPI003C76168E
MRALPFRLHHLGILVRDLAESREAFASGLGYVIESDPIDDDIQTARVQFLRLPGERHWIELVTPQGPDSKLQAALERGVSSHHVCYEVDDLDSDAQSLRARGFMPLGHPSPGAAFDRRPITWLMGPANMLVELVQSGPGARSLATLDTVEEEAKQRCAIS